MAKTSHSYWMWNSTPGKRYVTAASRGQTRLQSWPASSESEMNVEIFREIYNILFQSSLTHQYNLWAKPQTQVKLDH